MPLIQVPSCRTTVVSRAVKVSDAHRARAILPIAKQDVSISAQGGDRFGGGHLVVLGVSAQLSIEEVYAAVMASVGRAGTGRQ